MEKKWFLIEITYYIFEYNDTLVEYVSEKNLESILPNGFWMDDNPSLKILELTIEGEKKERLDLVKPIILSQIEVYQHRYDE